MDPIAVEQTSDNLGQLYERHSPRAFRLAYLLTGDRDAAEDLVQDAFVKLIGRFADLRRSESFEAYLTRTVVNLSYGMFRRRRVERTYLDRERTARTPMEDKLPNIEERDRLLTQLQAIAPRQRAALVLRYYEDLSEEQAANVLGCSLRTVKSLVTRGMQAMRGQQEDEL
jgi:RNA polymerase sigma-70 factor (sigma-E family)